MNLPQWLLNYVSTPGWKRNRRVRERTKDAHLNSKGSAWDCTSSTKRITWALFNRGVPPQAISTVSTHFQSLFPDEILVCGFVFENFRWHFRFNFWFYLIIYCDVSYHSLPSYPLLPCGGGRGGGGSCGIHLWRFGACSRSFFLWTLLSTYRWSFFDSLSWSIPPPPPPPPKPSLLYTLRFPEVWV